MAEVILNNVSKIYDSDVVGCKEVDLKIKDKEFCILVGPSGCGKSTTLRAIAGLEEITSGELKIDDIKVNDMPPKDRDIAMVFQNYALYPHMKVRDNMAFGLKLRKYPKKEIDDRVDEAAKILGITHLLDRRPKQLSGGQRQRVALGRAIVRKPKVFLFDEPLSNLDAKLRVQMRVEIKKLHAKLQTTMIYVTHDQVEAMTMGDRIVVMRDGLIQQVDEPIRLYNKPTNLFVAGFMGSPSMNFINVRVVAKQETYSLVESGDGDGDGERFKFKIKKEGFSFLEPYKNCEIVMGIRPEDVIDRIYAQVERSADVIHATVEAEEPMGSENYIHAKTGRNKLVIKTEASNRVKMGDELELLFNPEKIHIFNKETSERIDYQEKDPV
ncbi:MAG: sn-glycerol-3-phosphate ABC transporter ATP-binding protein UgpC [Elusimicrobiota bacterium]